MKAKHYVFIVLVVVVIIFVSMWSNRTRIEPFNAKPESCAQIKSSGVFIPKHKRETTYKTKITIFRKYSPGKHLEENPEDVAVLTYDGEKNVVIVLTNNEVTDDYLVKK